mmetsp:Transcript_40360/g.72226  ORF Transcript_40360/g.72226 Transcript_40360/m.72226 type:complete len:318 (+) Transcript_40360:121-1074(+)
MMRAIETAWLQFGKRKVHVIPHIGEAHRGISAAAVAVAERLRLIQDFDNSPRPQEDQFDLLKSFYPDIRVDYGYRNDTADALDPSSWVSFEAFLERQLLPSLELTNTSEVYTIGVGTHSLFLRFSIGRPAESRGLWQETRSPREMLCVGEMPKDKKGYPGKPFNNQALEIFYDYNLKTGKLTLDTATGCKSLGKKAESPFGVRGAPKSLCQADFERCIPVWRKLTQNATEEDVQKDFVKDVAQMTAGHSRKKAGPVNCETYQMCGYFPEVDTAEQRWVSDWRREQKACERQAAAVWNCPGLPEYPDVTSKEVCTCAR